MKNTNYVRRRLTIAFSKLTPFRTISFGFLIYVLIAMIFICLPFAQKTQVSIIDNLFNVVSAMSTTGLATGAVGDLYTFWGKLILLILMQVGAIGYMTLTSFFILSRGDKLSKTRVKILSAEFSLPKEFNIRQFIKHVVIFSLIIEMLGALFLWKAFDGASVINPLKAGIFHSVSAFATAGFSLWGNSLENFKDNVSINVIIGWLCYTGAIGFIVPLDIYRRLRGLSKEITFTSKIILSFTLIIFILGSAFYLLCEHIGAQQCSALSAMFQIMSASTTAGFNSVSVAQLCPSTLAVIIFVMLIGASPSGTGGGVKTTTLSAIISIISSVLKGQSDKITFFKRTIPLNRIFNAVAVVNLYFFMLFVTIFLLCMTEKFSFLELCFEATSALGTVGLSMGITPELSNLGKLIITAAMYLGRVGPLTVGLAFFFKPQIKDCKHKECDLAT